MKSFQKLSTRLRYQRMTTKELFWMMVFQHLLLEIKKCLNKMTGVLGKIIKVFEVIVEMLKTLKNKFKKSTDEKSQ